MNPIEAAIRAARADGRPALASFVTGGSPDLERFPSILEAVSSASDLVEVGVPFSDPMADGLTIQRSSRRALEGGANLEWILDAVGRCAGPAPVLLMSYLNPLLAYGLDRLAEDAGRAGVRGMIVPDLPLEECEPLRVRLEARDLALVQLVTPVTPAERLARACAVSRGFVYAVTMTGTTGARAVPASLAGYLGRVRDATDLPVLAGFGIRTAHQVRAFAELADGVIVGSALVEALERGEDPGAFLRELSGLAERASGRSRRTRR